MDESNTTRIVILGKTGAGKSSLANTIFGENVFRCNSSSNSETRKCQAKTKSVNRRSITLIDTPGFFDTDRSEEELKAEIVRCITECAPGPHAFLIMLRVEKFTEHEQAVINKISEYFSEEAFKYVTIVFTHGDQLDEGQTIDDFVHSGELVSDLVKKCGGRCHVIDNKYWKNNQQDEYRSNQFQVEEILKTIDKTTEANKGSYYTNEMLQTVEEEIRQEEENIRLRSGNIPEKEIREQAKLRIFKKLLIGLAGTATGVVLGALLGAAIGVIGGTTFMIGGIAGAVGPIVGAAVESAINKVTRGAEAAKEAAKAVKNEEPSVLDRGHYVRDKTSQPKLKWS